MTRRHWVTLEGKISWDGIHLVFFRDDDKQSGNVTVTETQRLAKRHSVTYVNDLGNGNVHTNITNGDEQIVTVWFVKMLSAIIPVLLGCPPRTSP